MSYKVTIEFTNATKTYTILDAGFSFTERVGAKGKHATQSIALEIKSSEAAALFLTETKRFINCTIKNGSTAIFEGVARPYQSVSASGPIEDNFSFEVMDYSEMLEDDATEKSYQDTAVSTIITNLLAMGGVSGKTLDIPDTFGSKVIPYFYVDPENSVLEVLQTFLFEFGYDFRFTVGTVSVFATTITARPSATATDVRGTLKIERSDDIQDGIKASYNQYMTKSGLNLTLYNPSSIRFDYSLFSGSAGWNGNGIMYYSSTHGRYIMTGSVADVSSAGIYPDSSITSDSTPPSGDGRIEWSTQDIQAREGTDKTIKIVKVENVQITGSILDESGVSCSYHVSDVDATGCTMWVAFNGRFDNWWGTCWGWNIKITADVTYFVGDTVEYGTVSTTSGDGAKNDEVTLYYVTDSSEAEDYAKREWTRQKPSALKYSFSTLTPYTVGGFYKLIDTEVTGLNADIRILTCKRNVSNGTYSITAEGAQAIDPSLINIKGLVQKDISGTVTAGIMITATASRLIADTDSVTFYATGELTQIEQEGLSYKWYLNDLELSVAALTWTATATSFVKGSNVVSIKYFYDGNVIRSASYTLERIVAEKGDKGDTGNGIESVTYYYAVTTDQTQPAAEKITSETIPGMSPINKYLWEKEVILFTDDTTKESVSLSAIYGDTGSSATAKTLQLIANASAITRNDRLSTSLTYTFTAVVQNYDVSTLAWYRDDVLVGTGQTYTDTIAEKGATEHRYRVISTADNNYDMLTLSVADETGDPIFIGASSSAPTQTEDGQFLIEGDYYVSTNADTVGCIYQYDGDGFNIEITVENGTAEQLVNALNALKAENIDLSSISSRDSVSWFTNIIADTVVTDKIKAKEGFFKDISITGDAKLFGKIYSDVLSTVDATEGDSTGVTSNWNPQAWDTSDLWSQKSNIPSLISTATSSSYGGNSISYFYNNSGIGYFESQESPHATSSSSSVSMTITTETANVISVYKRLADSDVYFCWWATSYTTPWSSYNPVSSYTVTSSRGWSFTKSNSDSGFTGAVDITSNAISAGDVITIKFTFISDYTTSSTEAYGYLQVNTSSSFSKDHNLAYYTNGNWVNIPYNTITSDAAVLNLNGLGASSASFSFNSSSYLKYGKTAELVGYSKLITGKVHKLQDSNINGVTATHAARDSSTQITVYTTDGNSIVLDNGWNQYYGTLKVAGTSAGVEMMGQYPKTDDSYDIGTSSKAWSDGYINNVHGTIQSSSARASKTDISTYCDDALKIVNDTLVVNFHYIRDKQRLAEGKITEDELIDYVGFIADDTDKTISGKKQDSMLVNNCIGVLLRAVQQLSAKVSELEDKLNG